MTRAHVDELYTAYLENSLPDAVRQEVDAHLRDCPQCREELEEMRRVVACLREMPQIAVPSGFVEGVRARLPQPRPIFFAWRAPALAGGLLVAAVAVFLVILNVSPTSRTTVATVDQTPATLRGASREQAAPKQFAVKPPQVATLPRGASPDGLGGITDPFKNAGDPLPSPRQKARENWRVEPAKPLASVPPASLPADRDRATIVFNPPTENKEGASSENLIMADASAAGMGGATTPPPLMAAKVETDGSTARNSTPSAGDSAKAGPAGPTRSADTAPSAGAGPMKNTPPSTAAMSKATPSAGTTTQEPTLQTEGIGADQRVQYSSVSPNRGSATAPAGQRLSFGLLTAEAARLPDGEGPGVLLRVSGAASVSLAATVVRPAGGEKQQLTFPAQSREIQLKFPKLPESSAVKLELRSGTTTGNLYLIVPGAAKRANTAGVRLQKGLVLPALLSLANDAGVFVLCSAAFAEQTVTFTADNMPPREILNALARQLRMTTTFSNHMLNVTPAP
ncbi:MAG: anti-sigma factor family protein [Armatimonadota bacterium]